MYDRQRNPRRRGRHRDHASERAAIDAVLGGILIAGLRRGCRVARVANDVEGIDDSVGRRPCGDEACDQRGKGNGERRYKCNGTP